MMAEQVVTLGLCGALLLRSAIRGSLAAARA
jgi:hypothetical protein